MTAACVGVLLACVVCDRQCSALGGHWRTWLPPSDAASRDGSAPCSISPKCICATQSLRWRAKPGCLCAASIQRACAVPTIARVVRRSSPVRWCLSDNACSSCRLFFKLLCVVCGRSFLGGDCDGSLGWLVGWLVVRPLCCWVRAGGTQTSTPGSLSQPRPNATS